MGAPEGTPVSSGEGMYRGLALSDLCVCGHRRSAHWGAERGPCIAKHGDSDGSVCPCLSFELKAVKQGGG